MHAKAKKSMHEYELTKKIQLEVLSMQHPRDFDIGGHQKCTVEREELKRGLVQERRLQKRQTQNRMGYIVHISIIHSLKLLRLKTTRTNTTFSFRL